MKQVLRVKKFLFAILLAATQIIPYICASPSGPREFLTEEEINKVRAKQEIGPRVEYYLEAAKLRLESASARLEGEETLPGDPMEYFTPEDMLDGYYRILNSVMLNLEDAYQKSNPDSDGIKKALKELRKRTEECQRRLDILETLAEEQNNKELLRLIDRAIDITNGAYEGARHALEEETGA